MAREPTVQPLFTRRHVASFAGHMAEAADDPCQRWHGDLFVFLAAGAVRLLPLGRRSTMDTAVCGFRIPAGTDAVVSTRAIHRDPTLWEEPRRFEPDRFLPERAGDRDRWAYLPFGWRADSRSTQLEMASHSRCHSPSLSPVRSQPASALGLTRGG